MRNRMGSETESIFMEENSSSLNYVSPGNLSKTRQNNNEFSVELSIALYSIIFVLSVTGNILVFLTLIREKKMRTVTNLFLMNLAISDMMLSVLCMPFTLVATTLLRNFIFGNAMCVIIRYFQAVSVGVSCYTLVAISLERYYAICQPLKSRRWQTLSHARHMIIGIWVIILIFMIPIAAFHKTIELRTGVHACREIWPKTLVDSKVELIYNVALSAILLLIPLLLMGVFYGLMSKKLWTSSSSSYKYSKDNLVEDSCGRNAKSNVGRSDRSVLRINPQNCRKSGDLANRKRVIRMLVVIVMQYFICWTPLTLLNAWNAFDFRSVLRHISPMTKSLILLLAYTSSFIHPITYCFMNRFFRQGFKRQFQCSPRQMPSGSSLRNGSENGIAM